MAGTDEIILGIDLGTTFSAMGYVDRFGKPNIIPNADGYTTTPSVVHFYDQDACVVGEEAVKMVVLDPTNVVRFIKRNMGDNDFALDFFGRTYTPQELSAFILTKLRQDAEEALGKEIKRVVITVPAYFNSAQRGATAEAGAIANLDVLSIINEPTAAAIYYGLEQLGGHRRMMVFDLGGGTFDVTVMEIQGNDLRTLASDGNAELGGKDWDDRLLSHVADQFRDKFGLDPRDDPQPYQELYERCLHAKIALSSKPRAVIPVNYRGHRMVVSVTRDQFQVLCDDLLMQCKDTCQIVLRKAGLNWSNIDDVLAVGGSTRMPMIQEMLQGLTGQEPAQVGNPEECVCLGAALAAVFRHQPSHPALQAHRSLLAQRAQVVQEALGGSPDHALSAGEFDDSSVPATLKMDQGDVVPINTEEEVLGGLPGVRITDIATHPLGIVVLDANHRERVVNLIPESTALPYEKRGRFAYAYDNMTAVRVEVTEGHGQERGEVTVIGQVILDKLPPRPRGTPIDVVYRYNVNNILEVDIIDVETGKSRGARLDLKGSLSKARLEEARAAIRRATVS
jgi:molecular chaperone DnaK